MLSSRTFYNAHDDEPIRSMDYTNKTENTDKLSHFKLFAMVLVWYSSAIVSVTTSKVIMTEVSVPFSLCTVQFCFASMLTYLYLSNNSKNSRASMAAQQSNAVVSADIQRYLFLISMAYTLGFLFTNWAFSIVTTSFAETVKASEPLTTTFISLFFFKEPHVSSSTYLALLPICGGVAVSCIHSGDAFSVPGFILAALSNFGFSGRAVLTKCLHLAHPEVAPDEMTLFMRISRTGLLILVPAMLLTEHDQLLHLLRLFLSSSRSEEEATPGASLCTMALLFCLNGTVFTCYNLMSYIVLRQTDLVTHSVLNAFRRVVIILCTSCYFSTVLAPLNILGVLVAVAGVGLFGYLKSTSKPKSYLL